MNVTDQQRRNGPAPAVSVIIPVYASEGYLEECLASVRSQCFKDFECIVVDDCSPEGDVLIAGRFAGSDSRFRLLHNKTHAGVSAARNTGLRAAHGKYVLFLDADDVLLPMALQSQYELATRYDADVVRTCGELWHGKGRTRIEHHEPPSFSARTDFDSDRWLQTSAQLKGLLIRRDVLIKNSIQFDCTLTLGEDIEFISRSLRLCRNAVVAPLITFLYRIGHKSLSNISHFSIDQWRSFGAYQRKVAENYGEQVHLRTVLALSHLHWNATHLARLKMTSTPALFDEVIDDLMKVYRGLDPNVAGRTTDQPLERPIESDPYLHVLFSSLALQRKREIGRCVDEMLLGPFRDELVSIHLARLEGDFQRRDRLTRLAYERQPWHPDLALEYGRLLLREGSKKAIELLWYAQLRSVQLFGSTFALCSAFAVAGRQKGVVDTIRAALLRAPNSPMLLDRLAEGYRATGDHERRLAALQQACSYAPRDRVRQERLIEGLLDIGKKDLAAEQIESFAKGAGGEWRERLLAKLECANGNLKRARQRIDAVVQATGGFDLAAVRMQANILMGLEEYGSAITPLDQAAYHETGRCELRLKLAEAASKAGDVERAFAVLNDILETPDGNQPNAAALSRMLDLLLENPGLGDLGAFIVSRAQQLARLPHVVAKVVQSGLIAPDKTAPGELAAEHLEHLLQIALDESPNSIPLLLAQIRLDLAQQRPALALDRVRKLTGEYPDSVHVQFLLGRCLAEMGHYLEASEAFEAAFKLAPDQEHLAGAAKWWRSRAELRNHHSMATSESRIA